MTARGLVIAAPRSGSGKTTVTLALLAALRRHGVRVRAAKAGPDYIDPAFHAAATGAPSLNLDSWAMAPGLLDALAREASQNTEIFAIEGVMGLFDGVAAAPGRSGSTADLAVRFGLPVVLVLDVPGQSQTAAAVARGLATHDPTVRIAGVVLNRVGSARHQALVADAMVSAGMPVLGAVKVTIPPTTGSSNALATSTTSGALKRTPVTVRWLSPETIETVNPRDSNAPRSLRSVSMIPR